jgi:Tfp pilus assembly protein FimV
MTVALRQPLGQTRRADHPVVRPHHSAATYRRRRAVAGLLLAGAVGSAALVAGSVLTGPGGVPASAAGAGTAQPARTVRARAGASLWSIAARFRGEIPIERYVEALITANGGTRIEAGQIVRLP